MAQGAASGTALCAIHYHFWKISSQIHSRGKQTENQFQKTIRLRITHPTKSSEALQDVIVDEAGLRRVTEGLVQEVVNEVDARLDGEDHALLQAAGSTQAPQPRQVDALHSLQKRRRFRDRKAIPAGLLSTPSYAGCSIRDPKYKK